MDNRDWMYMGWATKDPAWVNGTNDFLEHAFGAAAKGSKRMPCPYSNCGYNKRKHRKDVVKDLEVLVR